MAEKPDFETTLYEPGYEAKVIGGRFVPVRLYDGGHWLSLGLGNYSQECQSTPLELDLYFMEGGLQILVRDYRVQRLRGIPQTKLLALADEAMTRPVATIILLDNGQVQIESWLPYSEPEDIASLPCIVAKGEIATDILRDQGIPLNENRRIADLLAPRSKP